MAVLMRLKSARAKSLNSPCLLVTAMALVAFFAVLAPAGPGWAQAGACRNADSGPGCAKAVGSCSITDWEDCPDTVKNEILYGAIIAIIAASAFLLFPEIFIPFAMVTESGASGAGALGVELLAEDALLEETTVATAEEVTVEAEATQEVTAASEVTQEATSVTQQPPNFSFLSNVNPLGGNVNCYYCATETDQALATMFEGGNPDAYAPPWFDPAESSELDLMGDMENQYGTSWQDSSSMNAIANQLNAEGSGARGIVYVTDGTDAHVFNAVNYNGQTYFLDGQTTEVWTDANCIAGYESNSRIMFLQTGP
jgi:hypothetical protein